MLNSRDTVVEFINDIEPYFRGKKLTYVDVGAFQGEVFRLICHSGLDIAEAHLFEPNPKSFGLLKKYCDGLKIPSLHFYSLALGTKCGQILLQDAGSMSRILGTSERDFFGDDGTFLCQSSTLDEMSFRFTDRHISILKIDVEGGEIDVLSGASELLKAQDVDVIYLEAGANRDGTQQCYFPKIEALLSEYGYRLFRIFEQHHEWRFDLPLLRRMNCAYFSMRFANANPPSMLGKPGALSQDGSLTDPSATKRLKKLEKGNELIRSDMRQLTDRCFNLEVRMSESLSIADKLSNLQAQMLELEDRTSASLSIADKLSNLQAQIRELEESRANACRELARTKALNEFCARTVNNGLSTLRWWTGAPIGRVTLRLFSAAEVRLARRLIVASGIFDEAWYVKNHPAAAGNPLQHFLTKGVLRGFDPHPAFSTAWYLENYSRSVRGMNPLVHYLKKGAAAGLRPHPLFDSKWYRQKYLKRVDSKVNPLEHYLKQGAAKDFNPNADFDSKYYREVAGLNAKQNPLIHYLTHGRQKGLASKGPQNALSGEPKYERRGPSGSEEWISATKERLFALGFHQRGLAELQRMTAQNEDVRRRRLAAWELAVFHASPCATQISLENSLKSLQVAAQGANDKALRRISILRAECLQRLGRISDAKRELATLGGPNAHLDIYLASANLETTPSERLRWINRCFTDHKMPILFLDEFSTQAPYDSLANDPAPATTGPKVTVIVPAYNAANSIYVALKSLTGQTWTNTEIIVVDDGSTDKTAALVKQFAERDARVRLLSVAENSGPYVARNIALCEATGEIITCHDADDWSHSTKLESQARHLLENNEIVANMSLQARMFEDLSLSRRGKAGFYVHGNMSSLMFRRSLVQNIGFWDSVRFAGDSEYLQRIKSSFGAKSVASVGDAPLSFQKESTSSLTADTFFGYSGFKKGARRVYEFGHERFHRASEKPYLDFPLKNCPFAIPNSMKPRRSARGKTRHFDVVQVSDFRFPGGTTGSNVEEMKAQSQAGMQTALVQLCCWELNVFRPLNSKVTDLLDSEEVEQLVYGENVECDLLIVRHPWVLQDRQEYIPKIKAKNLRVIINQPPMQTYRKGGKRLYYIPDCLTNLNTYFGDAGIWQPIGPLVRDALLKHHRDEIAQIQLAEDDWHNIINIADWRRSARKQNPVVRLCRHSRDSEVKWPDSREELLSIYPESDEYEIHVLGGAEVPRRLLGGTLPKKLARDGVR